MFENKVNPNKLPVVYLFKAFSKESPEKFVGEHDVASLEKFVKDNVRNHFSIIGISI